MHTTVEGRNIDILNIVPDKEHLDLMTLYSGPIPNFHSAYHLGFISSAFGYECSDRELNKFSSDGREEYLNGMLVGAGADSKLKQSIINDMNSKVLTEWKESEEIERDNYAVYGSIMPILDVKGFKDILIEAVLIVKSAVRLKILDIEYYYYTNKYNLH